MSPDLRGNWILSFLGGTVQFALEFASKDPSDDSFHGKYTSIGDPSEFVARVFDSPRGASVLSMVQLHQDAPLGPYFAVYCARLTAPDTFQGTLFDVVNSKGDFTLARN